MTDWHRTGNATTSDYLPAMDYDDPEPYDDREEAAMILRGPVRFVLSLGAVSLAAALVLALWPHTLGL